MHSSRPKKSLLTFPQITHTPNLSLSGLAWTPAPLPHPDDLLVQKWPGPAAGALSSSPSLPMSCLHSPADSQGNPSPSTAEPRNGKHQIKTASPSSISAKGTPSPQNSPQPLHELHAKHLHTSSSSSRDVSSGLQTWMLYFSVPIPRKKYPHLALSASGDPQSQAGMRLTGWLDTVMDVAHQATVPSFLQHLPSSGDSSVPGSPLWDAEVGKDSHKAETQR